MYSTSTFPKLVQQNETDTRTSGRDRDMGFTWGNRKRKARFSEHLVGSVDWACRGREWLVVMLGEGVSELVHDGCVFEITTCRELGVARDIRGCTTSGKCRVHVWESRVWIPRMSSGASRISHHHNEAGGAVLSRVRDCLRGVWEMQP